MYIYLSLGEVRVIIIIMQDIFFSTKLPATCKKIASSESIKLVRGYSTARNDPWNVESLLSKDKESKKTLSCVVVVVVVQFFVYNVPRE